MDSHQINLYTAILITSLIIGSVILFLIISFARQQRRSLEIKRMAILSEINVIDREQTRIAADLHDDLGPTLTVIKFQVECIEAKEPDDQAILTRTAAQLDDAVNKVREIAKNLVPNTLIRNGLQQALVQLAFQTSSVTSLHVSLNYEAASALNETMSLNIYRIIQEIVQNAIKHASAELLIIKVWEEKGRLFVLCEDNGKGFDYDEKLALKSGLGLGNFRARVELMGGQLTAHSQTGKGTQYRFDIPIK